MFQTISRDYTNPVIQLYKFRGKDGYIDNLTVDNKWSAYNIKLNKKVNEIADLSFSLPFYDNRKADYDSTEMLVKFEGEYYIIKEANTSNMTTEFMCKHESEAWKNIYCEPLNLIAYTPQQMFEEIMKATKNTHYANNIKWKGTDVDSKVLRHLITQDEASVYENFIAMAQVFNASFEIINDKNDQRWFYLRKKPKDKHRVFKKELDIKELGINYNSENIFYRVFPTGYTDENGIVLDVQEAKGNTEGAIISNFKYPVALGVPMSVIDSEPQYHAFKTIQDENYIDANDLYIWAKEELDKCCVPTLDGTVTVSDLSAYIESPLDKLELMEKIVLVDKDIDFVFECKIVGLDIDYNNPLETKLEISNLIRYDCQLSDIKHTIDNANQIISTSPIDTDGKPTGDGKPYVPMEKVCDGDHWNVLFRQRQQQAMTTLNAQNIALRVEELEKSFAEINMTSQGIISTVSDLSNSMSKISQTSNSIVSTVESLDENMEKSASSIEQYSNKIKYSVTQGNFGSTLEQNPTSFLATFNQCSKYALLDDTEGLKLGDRTSNTYSKVGYDGRLELMYKNAPHPYHALSWNKMKYNLVSNDADEPIADYSQALPSMFDGIPDDQIQVTVSVAKNFPPDGEGQYVAYGHGCYTEVSGGYVLIYVVSTWREYDDDGIIIKDKGAVGGYMDVEIIVTA